MKSVGLILAALLAAVGLSRAQENWPAPLQEKFRAGVAAQKAGKLPEAEQAFLEVLREGGNTWFVHQNLGIVYQMRDDHARAIEQFREALRLDPSRAQPRALLGASLLAAGRLAEAVSELERTVESFPREAALRSTLARAYERAGNFEGRVDQLRALRELEPKEPEHAYQLARAYTRLSAEYFQRTGKMNPESARFHQILGETYFMRGQYQGAVQALERAAKADPKLPGIHLLLAQIAAAQGNLTQARLEVEKELAVMPESALAVELRRKLEPGQAGPRD